MPTRIRYGQDQPVSQPASDIAGSVGNRGLVEADRVAHLAQLGDQLGAQRLNLADAAASDGRVVFVMSLPLSGLTMPAQEKAGLKEATHRGPSLRGGKGTPGV